MKDKKRKFKIEPKEIGIDLLVDLIGSIFIAVSVQVFAVPAKFATAGVNGIALILNYLFSFKMGIVIMIINIPLVIICYKFLGRSFLFKSIKTIIISSLILDLLSPPLIPVYQGSPILAAIFNGILGGIGFAIIFMRNSSTGGTDFIIMSLHRVRPHVSAGLATQIVDGIIILSGAFCFKNVDAVLYGLISVMITSLVMDRIMVGANKGKVAFIVTDYPEEIAYEIDDVIDRGSTFLKAEGSYLRVERNVVFCACATRELYKIKKIVERVDEKAFMVITDSTEVYGEGFSPFNDK